MQISIEDRGAIDRWASEHQGIRKVWLYGSRARGDCAPDSDIDLAIETEGSTANERLASWMFADWKHELHLSSPVHMEWYDPEAELEKVGSGVESDGQLLYEA